MEIMFCFSVNIVSYDIAQCAKTFTSALMTRAFYNSSEVSKEITENIGENDNAMCIQWNLSVTTTSIIRFITCD